MFTGYQNNTENIFNFSFLCLMVLSIDYMINLSIKGIGIFYNRYSILANWISWKSQLKFLRIRYSRCKRDYRIYVSKSVLFVDVGYYLSGTDKAYFLHCCGSLSSMEYKATTSGTIMLQIWRTDTLAYQTTISISGQFCNLYWIPFLSNDK